MTTRSDSTTILRPLILKLVAIFLLSNLVAFLFAFFVWAPILREARAEAAASSRECRQLAAEAYRDGEATFDDLDEAFAECGGYRLR